MTSKRKPWLPDPAHVVEVIDVHSPETGDFQIQRTNIVDPYEKPLPKKKVTPAASKRRKSPR